jgi:uncharacterized membrane protein YphA (DoxX/SURF4 family)
VSGLDGDPVAAPGTGSVKARAAFTGSDMQRWGSLVFRLALGGVMVTAGLLKIGQPEQAVRAVQAYQILPPQAGQYVGYGLPLVEILLGIALIVGLGTRIVAVITGTLMVIFIIGVSSAWARGLSIDCGCFGGGGAIAPSQTKYVQEILRDVLFLFFAGWLIRWPASVFAVDPSGRAGIGDLGAYDEIVDADDDHSDEKDTSA